nr:recombinase family protein [uncultured Lichenicoccus sp.]
MSVAIQRAVANDLPDAVKRQGYLIGYARVSMSDQNTQRQIDELVRAGVDPRAIFTDSMSGATMKRPGWQALWKEIEAGDTVVILSLDRLGRNMVEIVLTVDEMKERGVGLKVLNGAIDTGTAQGRLLLGIFATLAEFERALIRERTQHGLEKARERGTIGGRPPKLTRDMVDKAINRVKAGEAAQAVADDFKVHRNTLKRRMDDRRKQIRMEKQK